MKSKIFLPLLLASLATACVESFVSVPVPFLEKRVADFAKYQNIYFIDFCSDIPDAGFDADTEMRRVFSEEMSFVVEKKVTHLDPPHWAMIRKLLRQYRIGVDIQFENSVFFQKVFKSHPGSLFFTGKLKVDIKKMGVVKEIRDEKGNMKNRYTAIQLWEMELKVFLIDGDAGQVLLHETFTEKMEPGEATSPQFNFNSMLAKITAKLAAALQPRKMTQERYILTK